LVSVGIVLFVVVVVSAFTRLLVGL
jgi:hypothetical protein